MRLVRVCFTDLCASVGVNFRMQLGIVLSQRSTPELLTRYLEPRMIFLLLYGPKV